MRDAKVSELRSASLKEGQLACGPRTCDNPLAASCVQSVSGFPLGPNFKVFRRLRSLKLAFSIYVDCEKKWQAACLERTQGEDEELECTGELLGKGGCDRTELLGCRQ
jgi:hypothetical protein